MEMIAAQSVCYEAKLFVALTSLLLSLSLPLAGCHPFQDAKMDEGRGAQQNSIALVGPAEPILGSERKPYSWPDGTMGLFREPDGKSYRFFAASAGFPIMTKGSLDDPIRDEIHELKIEGAPARYQYFAGGPIYRSDRRGLLLMFYHAENFISPPHYVPFYSELGLARSTDGGMTWKDLGLVITPHASVKSEYFEVSHESLDVGWGGYAIVGEYFYLYFQDLLHVGDQFKTVNLAVARAKIEEVLDAAEKGSEVTRWEKFYQGFWAEPGIGGRSSPLTEKDQDSFILMSDVAYSSYLKKYIGLAIGAPWPNTTLYWMESSDGMHWGNYRKLVDDEGHNYYATLIGLEQDPHLLSREFFVYYVNSKDYASTGSRNKDGVLYRRRVTLQ
jgi:hypothetical protein